MPVSVEDSKNPCPNWNEFLSKSVNALNPQPNKEQAIESSWNHSFSSKLSPLAVETSIPSCYGLLKGKSNTTRSVEIPLKPAALQPPKVTRFLWNNEEKPNTQLNSNTKSFESTLLEAASQLEDMSLHKYDHHIQQQEIPQSVSWNLGSAELSAPATLSSPQHATINTDSGDDFWLSSVKSSNDIMKSPVSYVSSDSPYSTATMTPSTAFSDSSPSTMGTPQYQSKPCTGPVFQSPIEYYSSNPQQPTRYYPTGTPKRGYPRERAASTTEIPLEFYANVRPRANSDAIFHSDLISSPHSERIYPISSPPMTLSYSSSNTVSPDMTSQAWYYEIEFKRYRKDIFIGAPNYKVGDYVKVEADRGYDLGHVVKASSDLNRLRIELKASGDCEVDKRLKDPLKMIQGLATPLDLNLLKRKFLEECGVLELCRNKVLQRKLPMKVIDAEFQFDRHKLTFYFEADGRIDFRELVRDLFAIYKTRIWMQQVTSDPVKPGSPDSMKPKFSK